MEELKPCPFCGGEAIVEFKPPFMAFVRCVDCESAGSLFAGKESDGGIAFAEGKAIDAWNRRSVECDRDDLIELADYLEFEKDTRWTAEDIRKALGVE